MPEISAIAKIVEILGGTKGQALFAYAKTQVGQVKSGIEASTEFGCAEAVNKIFKECFGSEIGGGASTALLFDVLSKSSLFRKVMDGSQGDVIISPTGEGNGSVPNGHVGIMSDSSKIMSNNSSNGVWDEHLDIISWKSRYAVDGGYPIIYFRLI